MMTLFSSYFDEIYLTVQRNAWFNFFNILSVSEFVGTPAAVSPTAHTLAVSERNWRRSDSDPLGASTPGD